MEKIKILVAGDPASIHANRFIEILQELNYSICIFACEEYYLQEEHIKNAKIFIHHLMGLPINKNILIDRFGISYCNNPFMQFLGIKWQAFKKKISNKNVYLTSDYKNRVPSLVKLIKQWEPNFIISLKMQNEGYAVLSALEILGSQNFPKWIHFSWGTDIEFFGKEIGYTEIHKPIIQELLNNADYLITDCERDARQSKEFGFKGVILGTIPAPGGFSEEHLFIGNDNKCSLRKYIVIKGRDGGYVGRALNIVTALQKSSDLLRGFKIKFIMSTENIRAPVQELIDKYGLDCEILERVPYEDLITLMSNSRLSIAASTVDGTPGFLMESMNFGAFPIYSDMESIREWISDMQNGLTFPVDDIDALVKCIALGLSDDDLVDKAQNLNKEIAFSRMSRNTIRENIKEMFDFVTHKDNKKCSVEKHY